MGLKVLWEKNPFTVTRLCLGIPPILGQGQYDTRLLRIPRFLGQPVTIFMLDGSVRIVPRASLVRYLFVEDSDNLEFGQHNASEQSVVATFKFARNVLRKLAVLDCNLLAAELSVDEKLPATLREIVRSTTIQGQPENTTIPDDINHLSQLMAWNNLTDPTADDTKADDAKLNIANLVLRGTTATKGDERIEVSTDSEVAHALKKWFDVSSIKWGHIKYVPKLAQVFEQIMEYDLC